VVTSRTRSRAACATSISRERSDDALVDDGKEVADIIADEAVTFGREPDVETAAVGAADHPRHEVTHDTNASRVDQTRD